MWSELPWEAALFGSGSWWFGWWLGGGLPYLEGNPVVGLWGSGGWFGEGIPQAKLACGMSPALRYEDLIPDRWEGSWSERSGRTRTRIWRQLD